MAPDPQGKQLRNGIDGRLEHLDDAKKCLRLDHTERHFFLSDWIGRRPSL